MYPLFLKPVTEERPWGSGELALKCGLKCGELAAETILLSSSERFISTVKDGTYKGKKLTDVFALENRKLLGARATKHIYFPLSVRLYTAESETPLTVLTGKLLLKQAGGCCPGDRLWYVLSADGNSEAVCGFNRNLSPGELENRLRGPAFDGGLNRISLKKGDSVFIPANVPCAIGSGMSVLEIRRNCENSFCVADAVKGFYTPREEFFESEMLSYISLRKSQNPVIAPAFADTGTVELYSDNHFTVYKILLNGETDIYNKFSFVFVFVAEGKAEMYSSAKKRKIKKGDSILIPAGVNATMFGEAEFICTQI